MMFTRRLIDARKIKGTKELDSYARINYFPRLERIKAKVSNWISCRSDLTRFGVRVGWGVLRIDLGAYMN